MHSGSWACHTWIRPEITQMKSNIAGSEEYVLSDTRTWIDGYWFLHLLAVRSSPAHLKKFYWSWVDLQCCDNFCCTRKGFSYTCTRINSLLDLFSHIDYHSIVGRVLYHLSFDIIFGIFCLVEIFKLHVIKWLLFFSLSFMSLMHFLERLFSHQDYKSKF